MLGLLVLLAVGLVVYWAALVGVTVWRLTHPRRQTYAWAVARGRPGDPGELDPTLRFRSFSFRGEHHDLPAWEIEGGSPGGPVVVITHGWGESRVGMLRLIEQIAGSASRVVAWDLPGHGESPGVCRLGTGEHRDLIALVGSLDPGAPLVLYGRSLGAGVSIEAARELGDRVALVVAEAPYNIPATPARNVMRLTAMPHRANLVPAFWLMGLRFTRRATWKWFDRRDAARDLGSPLVVLHGADDEICPIADGRSLAEAAGGTLIEIGGAGHHDLWTDHAEEASRRVRETITAAVQGQAAQPV